MSENITRKCFSPMNITSSPDLKYWKTSVSWCMVTEWSSQRIIDQSAWALCSF